MSVASLVQALERDAAEQIRALLEIAAANVAQLEARAARRRDDASAHACEAWRADCRAHADERIATARRTARSHVLTARAAMLDRVRAAVTALLPAYADRARPALRRAALAAAGGRNGVARDVPTGVVIELDTGTEIVATLEALLEREWPRLAAAILAQLETEVTS